jgi:quaternary ammonium compound-resistance protein SugE
MAWVYLFIAGACEVAWAIGLKYSEGLSLKRPGATSWTLVMLVLSFLLLAKAVARLPVGTAYVMWTGIGAVGTATLGIVLFREPHNAGRLVCIFVIVAGMAGLKWFTPP